MKSFFLCLVTTFCLSCERAPHWTDDLSGCLAKPEINLLLKSLNNFEKVLNEQAVGNTLTEKYLHFLKEVERRNLLPDYYHHLLIKETTKRMLNTKFYEQMWQQSTQWVLNDGKGTPVYIINGFGKVPICLAKSSQNAWFTEKLVGYKKPVNPVPSFLAKELLTNLSSTDYEQPQIRVFIALSLCYQLGVAYYDK